MFEQAHVTMTEKHHSGVIFISEAHIYFTRTNCEPKLYPASQRSLLRQHHTNIHSLEHSTTWDVPSRRKLRSLQHFGTKFYKTELFCLLCLHQDSSMYMKCRSHLDYIQQYINPVKHTNYTDDTLQQPTASRPSGVSLYFSSILELFH